MLPLIEAHRAEIAELCRRFHVRRLDVFGSAARGTDFDPTRSDVDLLVSYTPDHRPDIGAYLELCDALADLLGRPVDLIMENAVENPFVLAGIERSRQPLYGP
jgi:uncharacterized protein